MKNYFIIINLFCCGCLNLSWVIPFSQAINTLKVQIVGLPPIPLENVFKRLIEKQATIKDEFTASDITKFYLDIPKEIEEGIKPYGYFMPHIHSYIQHHYSSWCSYFTVNPGPQMHFTCVELQVIGPGSSDKAFQRLCVNFPIKTGDFFNSEKYERAKNNLFNIAASRGFFKAKMITSKIQINLSTYCATVIIIFDTGPQFRFGTTYFSHISFNKAFIQGFLQYRKGDYFNQEKIKQTREGLVNSSYFSTVEVNPQPKKAKGLYVPVRIYLHTDPKKQYSFGLGYGTDTGVRALVRTNFRRINSYGHRFNADLRVSTVNSALVTNYYIPGQNPAKDQYVFTAAFANQNQDIGKGSSRRFRASYQTNLWSWQQIISLTVLHEHYNLTGLPQANVSVLYPSILWQRVRADSLLNPERGYSMMVTISGAVKGFLSKTIFLQTRVNGRLLFTLRNQTRFIIRNSLGYTAVNNIATLPLSLQFFTGGAQSLRGFSYNSIGSGRNMIISSFEVQQRILKNFYIAAFIDVGNVSDQISKRKLKVGVGPGLVMLTPIGMFELTIANAISEFRKPWVIQFSMGSPL